MTFASNCWKLEKENKCYYNNYVQIQILCGSSNRVNLLARLSVTQGFNCNQSWYCQIPPHLESEKKKLKKNGNPRQEKNNVTDCQIFFGKYSLKGVGTLVWKPMSLSYRFLNFIIYLVFLEREPKLMSPAVFNRFPHLSSQAPFCFVSFNI